MTNRSHFPTVPTDFNNPYRRKNIFYPSAGRNIYFSYKKLQNEWECGNEVFKALVQHGLWRYHFCSNRKLRVGMWEYGG